MGRGVDDTTELDAGSSWQLQVVGALVLVACDPPPGTAPPGPEHPFAPAAVGDEWVYTISQQHPAVAMPGAEAIERILRAERAHGRLVARVRTELPGNPAATSERDLVITAEGVSPDIGSMLSAQGMVLVRSAAGIFLPRALTPGLTWQWSQEIEAPTSTMAVSATCEVVGEAQVQAPSGAFAAVHVRCVTRNLMRPLPVKGSPLEIPPIDHAQTDDAYYVRGVGLVRSVTTMATGYRSEKLLVRYRTGAAIAAEP